ncbi:DNA/RNA helicase domain-containing protein [Gammaproteobacteria bacterium AB-CW1]|uniref:DNA/RNA helicase domain-containing protein n=1 Tax=Natronospira elongata TaxID=3110268 RepID=A0AAP6JHI0_9GAMM|nr:DNA/RNA helicase domain-containing protein [Gammaproteobacteria bacterium AB-CW1]
MLVYSSDKIRFLDDVRGNVISDRIIQALQRSGHGSVSDSERRSFEQSLQYMKNVLEVDTIPGDAGIALEYKIPQTSKRVDMIVSGLDESRRETCVIVELKQWEKAEITAKDAIVRTFLGGAHRETTHPSYQAWSYASLLKDFNQTVQEDGIRLEPCAYLHNCVDGSGILDDHYQAHIDRAPIFLRKDMVRLQQFIQRHVRHGDKNRVLYRIEKGRIRPSRDLATSLARLIKGKSDFLMIDDQKLVYEAALEVSEFSQQGEKQVLIVEGGPGTGKSVVAINLLVELTNRYKTVHYVTPNRAPRQVYEGRLTGTLTKSRFSNMFKGSGSYDGSEDGELDVLVVDEAHRLVERGQYQKSGVNQTRDIIRAAKTVVFFVDEAQQVTWKDAGSRGEIEHWAKQLGATIHHADLKSQFRCNGSDGYLSWLDRVLGVHDTAQDDLAGIDYDLAVVDSPSELRERIALLNRSGHKARLVAGYCWDWKSKKDPDAWDITFPEDGFAMQWNLSNDEGRYIEKAESIDQIGCIHTVQGLEMDYVGVIIGPDLVVRDRCVVTQPEMRARTDKSLHGYIKHRNEAPKSADARADAIIKNTYRVLLSRGLKGCFIYCADGETQEYFRQQITVALNKASDKVLDSGVSPSVVGGPDEALGSDENIDGPRVVSAEDVSESDNAVPLLDLEAAAGGFAEGFAEKQTLEDVEKWIALPDFYQARPGLFAVRVVGDSMNRRIPNGSLGLFEAKPGGSRNGQVVLAYHRDIQDPDNTGGLTVKVYRSEKVADSEGEWKHSRIVLACDTLESGYEDIVLDNAQAGELQVLGVFKGIVA